jgi:hypothetical protein
MQLPACPASLPRAGADRAPDRALHHSLLAAALLLPLAPGAARAETAPQEGTISYKYLDYQDRQPGADRVGVKAHALALDLPLGESWSFDANAVTDAVSGASPRYHTQRLTPMEDRRNALGVGLTRYFARGSLHVGGSYSSESDYLSRSVSSTLTWFTDESKNTALIAGAAFTRDAINPSNGIVVGERKSVVELLAGVTQVFTPADIAQVIVRHARGDGYYSDPYKAWDERPRERNASTLLLRWNHHLEATDASVRTTYRYYTDTFGLRAHTLGLEFEQPLGAGWAITPLLRLYSQNAASFYVPYNPGPTGQTFPDPGARYYTEDQRLSAFGAVTAGLKVAWQLTPAWLVDAKVEAYRQRGEWALRGRADPGLAPFSATSVQVGVTRRF